MGSPLPTPPDISLRSEADDEHLLWAMQVARISEKGYYPNNNP